MQETDIKILLIRTIRNEFLFQLISAIRKNFSCETLVLLTHQTTLEPKSVLPWVDEVVLYDNKKDFGLSSISWKLLMKLRSMHFDLVVFPYYRSPAEGYGNVILLAFAIGGARVAAINTEGACSYLAGKEVAIYLTRYFAAFILTAVLGLAIGPYALAVYAAGKLMARLGGKKTADE